MAIEKKPTIYTDRGTIGSSAELDKYGVWVKSEPQDLQNGKPDFPDFTDNETADDFSDNTDDFAPEIPDLDLPEIDSETDNIDNIDNIEDSADLGFSEISIDDDMDKPLDFSDLTGADLPELSPDTLESEDLAETELTDLDFSETNLDGAADLDDAVGIDSTDLDSPGPDESASFDLDELRTDTDSKDGTGSELSTQLLLRIAEELTSIRTELGNLKKDFAGLKMEIPEKAEEAEHEHKFLTEDEDEKIALTGDELNNILNTADFTEETGTDATGIITHDEITPEPAEDEDSETFSINDLDGGLDLSLDELSQDNSNQDELSLDELNPDETDETAIPNFDDEAGDELLSLSDEGAQHMTSAPDPEDENYLGEDPNSDAEFTDIIDEEEDIIKNPEDRLTHHSADDLVDDFANSLEEESALEEESLDEVENLPEEIPPEEISLDEIPAEEISMDEFSSEESPQEENLLDLSEAVIDEPDLSLDIQDNPVEEPSLDNISIDLDLDEPENTEDDLALIPEGFPDNLDQADTIDEVLDETIDEEISIPGFAESDDTLESDEQSSSDELGSTDELSSSDDLVSIDDLGTSDELGIPDEFAIPDELDTSDELSIPDEFSTTDDPGATDDLDTSDELDSSDELTSFDDLAADDVSDEPDVSETKSLSLVKTTAVNGANESIPSGFKQELKKVLSYMDKLLESLPDNKIEEFARSEHFDTYKKLFKELGIV